MYLSPKLREIMHVDLSLKSGPLEWLCFFCSPACINPICGPDPKTSEIKRNLVMTSMDFGLELNYREMFLIEKKWQFIKAKILLKK